MEEVTPTLKSEEQLPGPRSGEECSRQREQVQMPWGKCDDLRRRVRLES